MIWNPCCEDPGLCARAFACSYDKRELIITHGALGTVVITPSSCFFLALGVIHKPPVPGASGFGKEQPEN